jgi:DNA-binding protein H-NS
VEKLLATMAKYNLTVDDLTPEMRARFHAFDARQATARGRRFNLEAWSGRGRKPQ